MRASTWEGIAMHHTALSHALRFALAGLLAIGLTSAASAATIEIQYTGTVLIVNSNGVPNTGLVDGAPFTATLRFDPAAADTNPDPLVGDYVFAAPPFEYSLEVAGYRFEAGSIAVRARTNFGTVHFTGSGTTVSGQPVPPPVQTDFRLSYETDGAPLPSDDLEDQSYALDGWLFKEVFVFADFGGGSTIFLIGNLETATIVPEPSTLLLVAGGLAALGARRRSA
jgi:hypothetical protein